MNGLNMIEHTLYAWANAGGIEVRTLERQLVKTGYTPKPRQKIPFKVIRAALAGDKAAAEIRLKEAQAADQERKNRIADDELVELKEVEQLLSVLVITPLRQALTSAPTTLDTLCNPTDPTQARDQLQQWVNDTLKMLPEKIGK
jgi:hypothetical protein